MIGSRGPWPAARTGSRRGSIDGVGIETLVAGLLIVVGIVGVLVPVLPGLMLVLVGIALWSFGTALVDWLLTNAEIYDAASAYVWITGSLNARTWDHALPLAVALAVLLPLALALSRALRILQFGDDNAIDDSQTEFVLAGDEANATSDEGPAPAAPNATGSSTTGTARCRCSPRSIPGAGRCSRRRSRGTPARPLSSFWATSSRVNRRGARST